MKREVVETCPECGEDNIITWDVKKQGWVARCEHCGSEMFLCDECLHCADNPGRHCDWREEDGWSKCFRGKYKIRGEVKMTKTISIEVTYNANMTYEEAENDLYHSIIAGLNNDSQCNAYMVRLIGE